eukprot:CAMPEP_0182482500 /NCGR_PEP_ID=MMETSP1319-20130603/39412_1 /TAXON_ID=172717 /ORGANISM="Bolidomonas pacifica, Strain RCC208" /LENGTH=32 /DNA_ID= /DNA_START= /DNA_END= /DNA_ORIENTATION=
MSGSALTDDGSVADTAKVPLAPTLWPTAAAAG